VPRTNRNLLAAGTVKGACGSLPCPQVEGLICEVVEKGEKVDGMKERRDLVMGLWGR
jgi:hypothetical protein